MLFFGNELYKNLVLLKLSVTILNMIYKRDLSIEKILNKNKALIIYGARQIGKTTLIKEFISNLDSTNKYKFHTGEDLLFSERFMALDFNTLINEYKEISYLIIDEAQLIPSVGKQIKILIDQIPTITVILSGSSSIGLFEVGEPLVGRSHVSNLYPLSIRELSRNNFDLKYTNRIHELMLFGSYPELINLSTKNEKIEYLLDIVGTYLLKDILTFDSIRNSSIILKLLKLLSYQIGNLVSYNELAQQLLVDVKTVQKYIDILEKSFIIFSLDSYAKNQRSAMKFKKKYYFVDLGIRNALTLSFDETLFRPDAGAMFENFAIIEKIKNNSYDKKFFNYYYFRDSKTAKEIDLIVERDSKIELFEFKTKHKQDNIKTSLGQAQIVTFENLESFLN